MLYARQWELQPALRYVAEWTTTSRLAGQTAAWRKLAASAVEPNPFYEPDYLIASAQHIEGHDIRCLAVYRDGARDSDLIGLFPLHRAKLAIGLPLPALEFYHNAFTCQTTPLIDAADPVGVWNCFFAALERTADAPRQVLSSMMPTGRGAFAALQEAQGGGKRALAVVEHASRAAVEFSGTYKQYTDRYSSRRMSNIRRRQRRLEETGPLTFRTVTDPEGKAIALADFLRIEAAGWKGQAKTAMAQSAATNALAEAVFLSENAEIDVLSFDGRAIAVMMSLHSGGVLYTIKTTYDETFSTASPGTILDQYVIQRFLAEPARYDRIDSCAIPGSAVETTWCEREEIASLVIGTSAAVPQSRVESTAAMLRSVGKLKTWVKEQIAARKS